MRTTPHTTTRRLITALCLGAALAPATAAAQDDEVFVDPDSPAGREYSIPSDEARDRTAPGSGGGDRGGGGGGGSGSDAFGAGVGDGGGSAGAGGGGSEGASGGGSSADERKSGGLPAGDDARRALEAAASQPAPERGSDTVLAVVGSGALVLALAAGVGAALRRRRT